MTDALPCDLPELPAHWSWRRLEQLVSPSRGICYGIVQPGTPVRNGVPILRAENVRDGEVVTNEMIEVAPSIDSAYQRSKLRGGEVLITLVGAYFGKVAVAPLTVAGFNTARAVGVVPLASDQYFVCAALRSPAAQRYIKTWATTTAQPTLNLRDLAKVPIPWPPSAERDAIAATIDALERKIHLNRRTSATLEEMARALFKSWFVDFGLSNGLLPDGWRHGSIDDVAELNPESWSSRTRPETIEYVDLSNTKWGRIEATTTFAAVDAPSRAQRVLRSGDSIIGTVRPGNGSFSLVRRDGLTGSTGFAVLRPRHRASSAFVYLAATRPETISTLAHLADGGAYPAVRPEIVVQQPAVVPTTQVLDEFAAAVDPLLARIGHADEESRTLAELRDLLLPKLLSGELRLRHAERAVEAVA